MKNKVLVISVDAMITSDLRVLKAMPELKEFFSHTSQVNEMLSVFPALTYPCHVAMITGCYPDRNGIYNNELFDLTDEHAPWYWYTRYHKVPDIFKVAHDNGLTTACIGWPSTSSNENVDYLISKIWTPEDEDEDTVNSPSVKEIFHKYKYLIEGHETEKLDQLSLECTREIVKEFRPDITYTYFALIDSMRHKKGYETEKHVESLKTIGLKIAALYETYKECGLLDDTTFVLCSDHGQINNKAVFNLNTELVKRGYITLDESGKIKSWRIYSHSAAFTSQVYTQNITLTEAKDVLEEIKNEYPGYIDRILDIYECEEIYHLSGPFSFVVDGEEGISFGRDCTGPTIIEAGKGDYRTALATHGHAPERGAKPPFIITGKRANEGHIISKARLIDEAPTILSIFGLEMPGVDGIVLKDLIKD